MEKIGLTDRVFFNMEKIALGRKMLTAVQDTYWELQQTALA
jgi:hypothetical protein